jgi:hypothetical protein
LDAKKNGDGIRGRISPRNDGIRWNHHKEEGD